MTEWMDFAKVVGGPLLILTVAGMAWLYRQLRVVIPHEQEQNAMQMEKERSQINLFDTLTERLPELQESQNKTCEQVDALHKRHDETQQDVKAVRMELENMRFKWGSGPT